MSRSTFSILFYANKSKLKNGIVPIMGRVTINGTQSQSSCKQSIPLDLWDVKGNRAKGRSREARNRIATWIISRHNSSSTISTFLTRKDS